MQKCDVAIVGAGPYGLSTAAHLVERGLRVAVFGKTLGLWRDHMPDGMLLRSHSWATNLSDPHGQYRFDRFLKRSRCRGCYPLPREAFIEYGLWFQEHAVPNVDETYVSSIERAADRDFLLALEDGRKVRAAAVVMATGLASYAHRPEPFGHIDARCIAHSCDDTDLGGLAGARLIVIGGGQSAIEYAALAHEAGAAVHVVSRRPVVWLRPDTGQRRRLVDRVLAPDASIAPGWKTWILDRAPYLFYRFSQARKDVANRNYYISAASDWLRSRVIGKIRLHEGHTVVRMEPAGRAVDVTISDGETLRADRIMLATGYQVNIDRLTMIAPSLRTAIATDRAIPLLNAWFESTVPGLYFVGLTSLRAFGPLYRFVAGCDATARRVARSIVRSAPSLT